MFCIENYEKIIYNEDTIFCRIFRKGGHMKVARYVLPDPDDRSKNDPCIILETKKVLGLYNQCHGDEEDMQKVTQKVQDWTVTEAKNSGWDEVKFIGSQCILENKFNK